MTLFCTVFYSLQTALHVSGETFTYHQELGQTVVTASGSDRQHVIFRHRSDSPTTTTGRILFVITRCCNYSLFKLMMIVPTHQRRRQVAYCLSLPDTVIKAYSSSWWWVNISPETCRAVCRE
jgi:hypothetical protein